MPRKRCQKRLTNVTEQQLPGIHRGPNSPTTDGRADATLHFWRCLIKTERIEAYNGLKDKVLAGFRDEPKPENLDEAKTKYGEEKFLELAWRSHVIDIQREIRAKTQDSAKNQLAALEAYARANPESDVAKTLALMKAKGAAAVNATPPIVPQEGGESSGTQAPTEATPETPTPAPAEQAQETPEKPARGRSRK